MACRRVVVLVGLLTRVVPTTTKTLNSPLGLRYNEIPAGTILDRPFFLA